MNIVAWLKRWGQGPFPTPARRPSRSRRLRPQVERLEDRIVLNNRFVVGPGVAIDNVTHFGTLHNALTINAAGRAAGDVIQIEPGAIPGILQPGDLSGYKAFGSEVAYTIQGDPTATLAQIPAFLLPSRDTLLAPLTLTNVNVHLQSIGAATGLTFRSNLNITGSSFVVANEDQQSAAAFIFGPASNNVTQTISGSTFTNQSPISNNVDFLQISPSPANTGVAVAFTGNTLTNDAALKGGIRSDLLLVNPLGAAAVLTITGNTFQTVAPVSADVLYNNVGAAITVTDTVNGNTFVAAVGVPNHTDFHELGPVSGLSIQNNTFTDASAATAVMVDAQAQATQIAGNTITLGGGVGIQVAAGVTGNTTTSAVIANNKVATGSTTTGGTGLALASGQNATDALNLQIQGNILQNNVLGVHLLVMGAAAPLGGIDLGGGSQHSLGGNDFRNDDAVGLTPQLSGGVHATAGAIGVDGVNPTIPISLAAQSNLFTAGVNSVASGLGNVTISTGVAASTSILTADLPGHGIFRYTSAGGWQPLTPKDASLLGTDAAGNVFAAFPRAGVYFYQASSGVWQQVTASNPTLMVTDAGGHLTAEFPGAGLWRYTASSANWQQLSPSDVSLLVGNANGDLAVNFPKAGVYFYSASTGLLHQLTAASASLLAVDATDNVVGAFAGAGLWRYTATSANWAQLTNGTATLLALDGAGDVAAAFTGGGVYFYTVATSAWHQLTAASASQLVVDAAGDVTADLTNAGLMRATPATLTFQPLSPAHASRLLAESNGDVFVEWAAGGLSLYSGSSGALQILTTTTASLLA